MRHVPVMDATGIHALSRVIADGQHAGTRIVLAELQPQPRQALTRAGGLERLGPNGVAASVEEALGGTP